MTQAPTPDRHRPVRAALLGLVLGCALGGLGLAAAGGWKSLRPPSCAPTTEDCRLEQDLARETGQRQLLFGGALLLLASGLWLLARRPEEDAEDED